MESERGKKPLHTAHYAESHFKRLLKLLCQKAPVHEIFEVALIVSSLINKLTYQQIEIEFRNTICQRSKALLENENITPTHRETLENIIEIISSCHFQHLIGLHTLLEHIERIASRSNPSPC
ncbi:MAG: hypothetical protein POELPBGB_02080 [Bacteroidia bacterium]|nr:hypothetical protein [Bacteroidia bacterium]